MTAERRALRFDPATGDGLLHWYETERRDLAWRRTRDPYRILVSEIMLQQTRVETVIPRYARFLDRFPSLQDLAQATEEEVLAEWSGLGYYRRARNLHRAAQTIVDQHGGRFPETNAELRKLPGVGDYTAAAVAAIAFGEACVGIDGNVNRVLCRVYGITEDPTRAAVRRQLREAAESLLGEHFAGDVTQALMELGARVCTPRAPDCAGCPLRSNCVARHEGTQETIPVRRKQVIHEVREAAAVIEIDGRFLLLRGQRRGVLQDMWEFPTLDSRRTPGVVAESRSEPDLTASLAGYLSDLDLPAAKALTPIGEIRHGITNRRIQCTVFRADLSAQPLSHAVPGRQWVTRAEAARLPLAASATRILGLLGGELPSKRT